MAYTLEGGRVKIQLHREKNAILVKVEDTGVGIPQHQLSRLFTKFFRGENVIRLQTEGSGLGLYIAKNIVTRHKGKMWVESEEGRGTTVYVMLPGKGGTPLA